MGGSSRQGNIMTHLRPWRNADSECKVRMKLNPHTSAGAGGERDTRRRPAVNGRALNLRENKNGQTDPKKQTDPKNKVAASCGLGQAPSARPAYARARHGWVDQQLNRRTAGGCPARSRRSGAPPAGRRAELYCAPAAVRIYWGASRAAGRQSGGISDCRGAGDTLRLLRLASCTRGLLLSRAPPESGPWPTA